MGLPCTCEECEKGWTGPNCDQAARTVHPHLGPLVLYVCIIIFCAILVAHWYMSRTRSPGGPEGLSLLKSKDSIALFHVDTANEPPHVRTKLYF